jgi:hypothetical protein
LCFKIPTTLSLSLSLSLSLALPAHDNLSLHFCSKEQRNLNRHERCVKSCWRTLLTVMTVVGTSQNAHIKSRLAERALSSVEYALWGIKLRTVSQKSATNPSRYPRFPKSF